MGANVVGVSIDARSIRAVEVKNPTRADRSIVRVARVDLPDGAVRGGEVIEPGTVSGALKHLWATNKFSTKRVALGFGGPKAFARDFSVPLAPIARIREQLPFTAQEMIPLPVAEALLDFYPSGEEQSAEGPVVRGILVAAQKDAVRSLVGAVLKAKLVPVVVDLEAFGMIRAVEPMGIATECVLTLGVGTSTSSIVITESGVPRFVRMIAIGGDDVTAGIAKRLQIAPAQAEQVKLHYGIAVENATEADRAPIEAVYAAVWDLLASVRDTLAYYSSSPGSIPVARIAITGEGAEFPGFDRTLAELTRLPVARAAITRSAVVGKLASGDDRALDEYVTALGLASGVEK